MSFVIGSIERAVSETSIGICGRSTPIVPAAVRRPGPARAVRLAILKTP